jgi:hypothetical protein
MRRRLTSTTMGGTPFGSAAEEKEKPLTLMSGTLAG